MAGIVVWYMDEPIEWSDIQWCYNIGAGHYGSFEFEWFPISSGGYRSCGMFGYITDEYVNGNTCIEPSDSD
ncbi:MAG: hypothetical protein EBW15_11230 [Actinobacteria bacterium]|nr:hypothetical protein [Actinomycetota bacterium]